jgi:hypothetical protein
MLMKTSFGASSDSSNSGVVQSLCSPGVTDSGANLTGLRSAKERARAREREESGRVIIR